MVYWEQVVVEKRPFCHASSVADDWKQEKYGYSEEDQAPKVLVSLDQESVICHKK